MKETDIYKSTKAKKAMNLTDRINLAIEKAKLDYYSDTSFEYRYDDNIVCVVFYKDESGKIDCHELCHNYNGLWISLVPTEEQKEKMFKILEETPDREEVVDLYREPDSYEYCGVKRTDFI